MIRDQIQFKTVQEWNSQEIVRLYRSAGWWEERYDPAGISSLITGSFIFVVGVHQVTGEAIAMGRILSDGIRLGIIQDLCVLDSLRGKGIGKELLDFLIQEGKRAGLQSIHLVAEPGTRSFYEKSGFISDSDLIFLTKTPDETNEN